MTGSNLIQFPADASPELKSSVALSLLAAQRVASNDPVILSPAQWLDRHNTVLQNLNWRNDEGGVAKSQFDSIDMAVHQAIIPFLTAALAYGSHFRRNACAPGHGNPETMERLGDYPHDTGIVGLVLARGFDGKRLDYKFYYTGSHGCLVYERAADLCRCAGTRQALFVEVLPFFNVESNR